MRIAVMGTGAMGTVLGALLTEAGYDVTMIDNSSAVVDALNREGAVITGVMEKTVPVKACTPDQLSGRLDLVFLLVESIYNSESLTSLLPHLSPESTVCTLQNGYPEYEVADIVGTERTIGGTLRWGSTNVGPGKARLTNRISEVSQAFDIGEMDGSITPRIQAVAEVLSSLGETEISTNLAASRWIKLMHNCAMSGLSTALGCVFTDAVFNDKALTCSVYIAQEVVRVAAKCGVTELVGYGIDPVLMGSFETAEEREAAKHEFREHYKTFTNSRASMLQDLMKGKPCEIGQLNGFVSQKGKEIGCPTPFNDTVTDIVRKIERGELSLDFDNLKYFTIPEL